MSTELRILTWCDMHARHGDEVPAQYAMIVEIAASAPGAPREPARRIDVCGQCLESLSGLTDALEEYGAAPDAPPPTADVSARRRYAQRAATGNAQLDPGTCLVCGREARRRAQHYAQIHQITLESTLTDAGYECPTCGKTFDSGMALAHHHSSAHGRPFSHAVAERVAAEQQSAAKR